MTDKFVMVDLDGTLCDTTHRRHLIDKGREGGPAWRDYSMACADDPLIAGTAALVRLLGHSTRIVYASGRDEAARELTATWLREGDLPDGQLLMRPEGDRRSNVEVKCEWVKALGIGQCVLAIDDYPAVLTTLWMRWRIPGLLVPSDDRRYDMIALERAGILTPAHVLRD